MPNHTRAYLHKSDHSRVQNLSDRRAIKTKEAYHQLISEILDEDGENQARGKIAIPGRVAVTTRVLSDICKYASPAFPKVLIEL